MRIKLGNVPKNIAWGKKLFYLLICIFLLQVKRILLFFIFFIFLRICSEILGNMKCNTWNLFFGDKMTNSDIGMC